MKRAWSLALGVAWTALACGGTPLPIRSAPPPTSTQPPSFSMPPDDLPRSIAELEQLLAAQPDSPQTTPRALLRLASLYELRAHATEDATQGLAKVIDLYKTLLARFPEAPERAGALYFLAHALEDVGKMDEAQQPWRALVCANHFSYPAPAEPLPQDHDTAYWQSWRAKHPTPESLRTGGPETRFVDPFPADCKPSPQPSPPPGRPPRFLAEAWWRIGNAELDGNDVAGGVLPDVPFGVYTLNRAASAYAHALALGPSTEPLYSIALYKLALTQFKQERFDASVRTFVKLIERTYVMEKESGDPGADFRIEAYSYIAGAIANVDFVGPDPADPFIARPDPLDTDDTAELERQMAAGVVRLQDSALIPQDRPYTPEIYRALAREYESLAMVRNVAATFEAFGSRWPLHPDAPANRDEVVRARLGLWLRTRSPGDLLRVMWARESIWVDFTGATAWVDANRTNADAMARAMTLARSSAYLTARDATQTAQAHYREGVQRFEQAIVWFGLAERAWTAHVRLGGREVDAFVAYREIAEARRVQIAMLLQLGNVVPPEQHDAARAAAITLRDLKDGRGRERGAALLVALADLRLDSERKSASSSSLAGFVRAAVEARDDYVHMMKGAEFDARRAEREYEAAEILFDAGQADEAERRADVVYRTRCKKSKPAFRAWLLLVKIAARDVVRRNALIALERAAATSCAMDDTDRAMAGGL